ncbi:hypothetical protein V8D89_002027, partial [Ganoderma adspersum]
MSSADESAAPTVKKRKLHRSACDNCKSKKRDGPDKPEKRCSNCIGRRAECTYVQAQNNSYPRSYVENLESRLERMEKLLHPGTKFTKDLDGHLSDNDLTQAQTPASNLSRASGYQLPTTPQTLSTMSTTPRSTDDNAQNDDDDDELDSKLNERMQSLSMNSQPFRYHGKSSGLVFIQSAMTLKNEYPGYPPAPKRDGPYPWLKLFVEDDFPRFEECSFPPRDLMDVLVDLYFCHMNSCFPLLHEPTFKRSIEAGLHVRNGGFGATVLLVCAIGSRFTRDPRVLLDGSDHPYSAGWKWFLLVNGVRRLSFAPVKLHDLQVYTLMALFLQGTTAPHATWAVVGVAIRAAVDVGAHRKKMYAPTPTVDEELWRRAFWSLVLLEWISGYGLGRPCSIHDEDFDLALPTECDDEYWLTLGGEPLFKQPPGKPSKVTAFVCMIRLGQIVAFATRTIYATNKSRAQLIHSDRQWEQRIVAELDSALNKWTDSLPSHLHWNPEEENVLFLTQAASLKANYYHYQVAVHRSFMPFSGSRESPLSFPSAIICTNAARSSIQVLEVLYKRSGSPHHRNMGILYMSGVILMVNTLGLKRLGRAVNVEKELGLVRTVIEMLRSLQYQDMLSELVSVMDEPLPLPAANSQGSAGNKAVMKRPSSPVALSLEGPLQEQHDTSQQPQPTAGTQPSFPPIAHPDAALHTLPGLDFLQSDDPLLQFDLPSSFRTEGLGPPAPGLVVDMDGSINHAQAASSASHEAGQSEFDMGGGGQMFPGLEPLGFNLNLNLNDPLSMSLFPSVPVPQPEVGTGDNHQHAETTTQLGADRADAGADADAGGADPMPDFALMGDTPMMWSSMPPT